MLHTEKKRLKCAPRCWEEVTSAGMTKKGYQAVMDKLTHIKKDTGDDNALDHYESLRGQDKLEFALKLKVDKTAAFMSATKNIMAGM